MLKDNSKETVTTAWNGFKGGDWQDEIDVRDFINRNYTPYDGDQSFLEEATEATTKLNDMLVDIKLKERAAGGVLDADTKVVSTITSHKPGYLDKDLEKIVGLQTDKPMKKALMPYGGIRMAKVALAAYGMEIDPETERIFTDLHKTHNQGVFDAYNDEIKRARHNKIVTGLPDSYGRGRIIADFPRVALYGIDRLIAAKKDDLANYGDGQMTDEVIRLREEVSEQIRALQDMKKMAASYGYDISYPATNAREAIQWLYFGYLASIKQQNGAAMSIGRIDSFIDIYIKRDMDNGLLTEKEAQELIDQFTMKLRMVTFIRTPEYNSLFSGNPIWATLSIAGMGMDGRHHVTKTAFRFLHTLHNMGAAPEPNITLLWSERLPEGFKNYAASVSIASSTIQYENDELMMETWGTDYYGIACCVSAQPIADGVQFFGARANLAKTVLYAINGGVDELTKMQCGPAYAPITSEYIDYDEFLKKFDDMLEWVADVYVNALNVIHYMHDKYYYESAQLALKDTRLDRTFATGISGLAVAADSISAIKYGKVKVIRDENGVAVDFKTEKDFPRYGNNDDRADEIAAWLVRQLYTKMNKHHLYRDAKLSTSVLTITSNVVYGKNTGTTPNGRQAGEPFSPGANPAYGAETHGALASLLSVAKLPYRYATDGISNTFAVTPSTLGHDEKLEEKTLVNMISGYMKNEGHHLNINVFNRDTLLDAQKHPEEYPTLTVRVSGYCVYFADLTKEQQDDVISRTFHTSM
ncbi:formate C-acetyltransferase [Lactobacillus sp. AN1001]|jgi:formate C-acetyltransferase|uniref:Formate acetyltransferase n=1 Tax=Ligilactobacillus murinus DSM 20452 = NBRC 14221 TaxID=1423772 RepID=A0A0R2BAB3_9LACO|nr:MULTISPECIES: formate C-acetyltransferase [Ligilactobacillus]KRM75994.1 formate acetyltransferase [Ligilactobacillus murinus DSM 20452 = NBRC 14221]MCI5942868.1 formate C-acetyltransferase [Ligilactobacillus animalis]MDY2992536.1 formate C-acetyltransferase [Ligilactobacillus animalis]QCQ03163.1 formate C-acetyltransferase [Ligilactobacillus animalis]WOY89381.1 formate C-acetyltransferase [Ligilactobacillus murinus]